MNASLTSLAGTVLLTAGGAMWALIASSAPRVPSAAWRVPACAALLSTVAASTAIVWTAVAGGWWFVGERALVYVPLALAAACWFAVAVQREHARGSGHERTTDDAPDDDPASASVRAAAWGGVIAAGAGLVMQFVVGFPAPAWGVATVIVLAAGTALLVAALLTGSARRTVAATVSGLGAVLVATVVTVAIGAAGPGALTAHAHERAKDPSTSGGAGMVSVASLRTGAGAAEVRVELEAQQQTISLPSGRQVDAWTFGELGGPLIEADEGELIEVRLRNRDIEGGVTAHWHGYAVPSGEDGAAGVTQDAVLAGGEFTYRFVADQAGTYWYHTHQRSSAGVVRGLYGPLVVHPRDRARADLDVVLPVHTLAGRVVMGTSDLAQVMPAAVGDRVRVRLINTDQVPQLIALTGTDFRVAAIDGRDLAGPTPISGEALRIPAGGRYDLTFEMPDGPVGVQSAASAEASLTFIAEGGDSARDAAAPLGRYDVVFDPLSYGEAPARPLGAGPFDVERTIVLDRLPRLVGNAPTYAYTVDGRVFPHIEPTRVREGDRVKLTVVNRGFETHPMHPHGHHVVVLAVDGRPPAGTPVIVDTFDVQPGQTWEIALVADNPGIWMDHCHNLEHAALGMVTHLAYDGVVSPFQHGGPAGNAPE